MLPNPPEGAVRQAGVVEAERKQVTALFCDLSGFTALSEKLDPEDTRQIVGEVFARAAEIVARYEGRIEKFVGDAVMALLGVPAAHEDDPVRALRAALELHAAVAELSPGIQARSGVAVALHSGVNTGIVVTGELQFGQGTAGPLGDTINLAARLMGAAPSGEIWVGPETRRLADAAFEFDDLGAQPFKGKAAPVSVARLRGPRSRSDASARSFRGAFVGRQAELGALLGAAEKIRDGQAQALAVRGDAGTGKTRLFAEFRARAGADLQWLEGRAYPYAQAIPYAPLIDLLSRAWGIDETDRPAQVRHKIETGLAQVAPQGNQALPLLLHLFHLPQDAGVVVERESFPDRLLGALRDLLSNLARRGPVVACLQDLQWVDPSTDIALRALVERPVPGVLLLVNFRPGYTPPQGLPLLDLTELSTRQTRELLVSLLQAEPPPQLADFIAERSDGNPFYVEEVVNALVETQVLVNGDGGWHLSRRLSEAGVPPTVRGVIAARIDRLDDVRRRVLRHAAVVGREFLYAVVAQVCDDAGVVEPSLRQLQAVDLIRRRRDEPDLEYVFKHALTQDVAYEGLLKAERQVLHARTARVMEAVLADRLPEYVETLAYHYLRGGVVDKAVHYLVEAGGKCVERYALAEAASHFGAAYALLSDHPALPSRGRALTRLLNAWSHVFYYEGAISAWRELLERHLDDAERCGDDALRTLYLGWVGNVRMFHGDVAGSIAILDRASAIGRVAGARDALAYVTAWRAFTLFELGRFAEAIDCARSLDQTEAERGAAPYAFAKTQGMLAIALVLMGQFGAAREAAEQLIAFGRTTGNCRAAAFGHQGMASYWMMLLDFDRSGREAEAGVAVSRDDLFVSMNQVVAATAALSAMRQEDALRICSAWMPYLERNENRWFGVRLRPVQCSARIALGDFSAGLRELRATVDDRFTTQIASSGSFAELFLALTWVAVARRDTQPPLKALLANPWFTFTQAPLAAHRAARLIARLRSKYEAEGRWGSMNLIELADARLRAHRGDVAGARDCLARIESRRREAGLDDRPAALQALADEIARRAARG
jgi:class 3 adenylate cyclase/tetratricopeptide (TPR) repeat protein